MKKIALILAFLMCFTSTMFFAGCNIFVVNSNNQNSVVQKTPIESSVQTQTIGGIKWYMVYTASEFNELCGHSVNIKLCNNLNLSTYSNWRWLLYENASFDGQGYKITGLKSSLFVTIRSSTIKNLTIENASLAINNLKTHMGILASTGIMSTIENCTLINSSITITYNETYVTDNPVGGFIGLATSTSSISNCVALDLVIQLNGERNYAGEDDPEYGFCVGGIVGYSECPITNCLVSGDISSTLNLTTSYQIQYVGGIAGKTQAKIEACQNDATITAGTVNCAKSYAGGIAGYSTNNISNCGNGGNITAYAKTNFINGQNAFINKGIISLTGETDGKITSLIHTSLEDANVVDKTESKSANIQRWKDVGENYQFLATSNKKTYMFKSGDINTDYNNHKVADVWHTERFQNEYITITFIANEKETLSKYHYSECLAYVGGISGICLGEAKSVYSIGNIKGGYSYLFFNPTLSVYYSNIDSLYTGSGNRYKDNGIYYYWPTKQIRSANLSIKNLNFYTSPIFGNTTNVNNGYYCGAISTSSTLNYTVYNPENPEENKAFLCYDKTKFSQSDSYVTFEDCNKENSFVSSFSLLYESAYKNSTNSRKRTDGEVFIKKENGKIVFGLEQTSAYMLYNGVLPYPDTIFDSWGYEEHRWCSVYNLNSDYSFGEKTKSILITEQNKQNIITVLGSEWLQNDNINNGYPYIKGLFH